MKSKIKSTKSSGNVFADLGLPNADKHLIKADIVLPLRSGSGQSGSLKPKFPN